MQVTTRTWHMREHVYQALYSPPLHESLGMRLVENIIGVGSRGGGGGGTGRVLPPPSFHKLLYKLLTTLCVVSNWAPQSKSLSYATE